MSDKKGLGRDYILLQAGGGAASIAGRCFQAATAWWALDRAGSTAVFSAMVACAGVAELSAKLGLGWLGDRYEKRRVAVACTVSATACVAAILGAVMNDYFQIVVIGGLLCVFSAAGAVREPLQTSILPSLVPADRVGDAIRVRSAVVAVATLMGPGIAGLLLSWGGARSALLGSAVAMGFATLLLLGVEDRGYRHVKGGAAAEPWWRAVSNGIVAVARVRTELCLALLAMAINFAIFPFFTVLLPALIQKTLAWDAWWLGWLDGCFGAGILLGSLVVVKVMNRRLGRDRVLASGAALLGLPLFAVALAPRAWIMSACMLVAGVGLVAFNMNASLVRTLATPESHRNRFQSTVSFLSSVISPLGAVLAGSFSDSAGLRPTIGALGGVVIASAALVRFIPNARSLLRLTEAELQGAYARYYPGAFRAEGSAAGAEPRPGVEP